MTTGKINQVTRERRSDKSGHPRTNKAPRDPSKVTFITQVAGISTVVVGGIRQQQARQPGDNRPSTASQRSDFARPRVEEAPRKRGPLSRCTLTRRMQNTRQHTVNGQVEPKKRTPRSDQAPVLAVLHTRSAMKKKHARSHSESCADTHPNANTRFHHIYLNHKKRKNDKEASVSEQTLYAVRLANHTCNHNEKSQNLLNKEF